MQLHLDSFLYLAVALVLSLIIGAEREFYSKSAGMRTTALVGLGAAVFTVVSREGHWLGDSVSGGDGARVAAQIVSGIGFLGAGLIFVRRDTVRGLTTAAGIWFVAAVGMASGAGVLDIAIVATLFYLLIAVGLRPFASRMPRSRSTYSDVTVTYQDGQGILRKIMETIGDHGVRVDNLKVLRQPAQVGASSATQSVLIEVRGEQAALSSLLSDLSALDGVLGVESHRDTVDENARN